MTDRLEASCPAKVNLMLRIGAREESGFHQLETIFCAIDLADTLAAEVGGDEIALTVEGGIDTGEPDSNLVVRAARAVIQATGEKVGLRFHLTKRIPSAAGLGGGSSDAATALLLANQLLGRPLGAEALLDLGSRLGSDVPFFLSRTPFALAWGRGERLLSLEPLPSRPVAVANPRVAISTAAAFGRLAEQRGSNGLAPFNIETSTLGSWDAVAETSVNDFEGPAAEQIDDLRTQLQSLRSDGACIAMLAGSGSSIFGVFEDAEAASVACEPLEAAGWSTWVASTLTRWTDSEVRP